MEDKKIAVPTKIHKLSKKTDNDKECLCYVSIIHDKGKLIGEEFIRVGSCTKTTHKGIDEATRMN